MNTEKQAYEAGYQQGYQRAFEEARAAIGPRFVVGSPSLDEAMRRRNRFQFWLQFSLNMLFAIPGIIIFLMVLQYAHDLQERCSQCICVTRTK